MTRWLRKHIGRGRGNACEPEYNVMHSRLLRLPGEIRNMIYIYTLCPESDDLVITSSKGKSAGSVVLRLPLIWVCHQIRLEGISFLCANKTIKISDIANANAWFRLIGDEIASISRLTLFQPTVKNAVASKRDIGLFFQFLEQAKSLKYLKLGVGRVFYSQWTNDAGNDQRFLRRVDQYLRCDKRAELNFEWRADRFIGGRLDVTWERRTRELRLVLGAERESIDGIHW